MAKQQNSTLLKRAMIEALEKTLGIVTTAAKQVGIDRTTHYKWLDADEAYKEAVEDISELTIDFAESQLHKQIKEGQQASTIFYLKTKGKKRGYFESQELRMNLERDLPDWFED